jgi:outer membrane immunogenic protein
MRNLLLAGVAFAAIVASSSVMAADLGMQPVYKAAPAPVVLPANWTGFYVGAHLGGAWGTKDLTDPFVGKSLASAGVNGFLGGGQIGYNYQIGWVVLGVEGDVSAADITGTAPFIFGGSDSFSSKTDWLATVTGRIGGTVDHALLYVKGGAAWAHDKYCINVPECISGTETRTGWVFGGGIEYAITHNWSGKVEYNYMDFGTKSVDFCEGGSCDPLDVRQRIHAVKVGVNYKFDWGR